MKILSNLRVASVAIAIMLALNLVSAGRAGCFGDCCLSPSKPAYPIATIPVTSGYGAYPYNAYTGYPNTSYYSPILPAGLPQTNSGLLPTGGYASQYYRAPTTYYRPVTAFDPNTGTTVTSLQPCASYQYQAQRVPLLVPSWSNYAYGGYGASTLENRWSPVTAPAVGGAAGQSSLSIASGMGTYGTSPVVQVPATGAVLNTSPAFPSSQPIAAGYGGIHYGQPLSSSSIVGIGNTVVPAAAWTTPVLPQSNPPSLNGATYASPGGGYFGSVPQTFDQPATVAPSLPVTSGYAPSGPPTTVNGVTMTPIGPPITTAYPTSPSANGSSSTWIPGQTSPTPYAPSALPGSPLGAMPGSMGQGVMPPAVSPTVGGASSSILPPVMPSAPAPNGSWSPSPASAGLQDSESTVPPSVAPATTENRKPTANTPDERPRFQLRSVERAPAAGDAASPSATSPWSDQGRENSKASESSTDSSEAAKDLQLKLNMETLRPIPAPQNFDASPDWKPTLLNVRDQTASNDSRLRFLDAEPVVSPPYHEVRFLHAQRAVVSQSGGTATQEAVKVTATLRPIRPSNAATGPRSEEPSLDTRGWSTVIGR